LYNFERNKEEFIMQRITPEYVALSRRAGRIMNTDVMFNISDKERNDFVRTVSQEMGGFDKLPERYKQLIIAGEKERDEQIAEILKKESEEKMILFYSHTRGDYKEFSNFYPSEINIDGKTYPTVEHYFQACKAINEEDHEKVRLAKTPDETKELGNSIKIHSNWEEKKYDVMLKGIYEKFTQHIVLKVLLLTTGDLTIHEHTKNDKVWGWFDGKGGDKLGKALMEVRERILKEISRPGEEMILFYYPEKGAYKEFSNFYPSEIAIDGKNYPTVEHYYQACKATDKKKHEEIRRAKTPDETKKMAREIKLPPDWHKIKFDVMYNGVYAKFTQNEDLKELLLSTGDKVLHEYAPYDMVFGLGDGKGKDKLGKILMEVREKISSQVMERDKREPERFEVTKISVEEEDEKKEKENPEDRMWEEFVEQDFQQFMEFFFSDIYKEIDFTKKVAFLDKELERIIKDGEVWKGTAQKLVKFYLKDGNKTWSLLHIEVNRTGEENLAKRIYNYYGRIYDKYHKEIACLVIFTDSNEAFRPDKYEVNQWGNKLSFKFPVRKLLDYRDKLERCRKSDNIFEMVVRIYLALTEVDKNDMEHLYSTKLSLAKEIIKSGRYNRDNTLRLLGFLDALIVMPDELETKFYYDEVKKMSFKQETGKDLVYPPPVEVIKEVGTCPVCDDYPCIDSDKKGNSYYECWNCGWIAYISPESHKKFMNGLDAIFDTD
jgi:ribA/ribD-fused uncharacterized protein